MNTFTAAEIELIRARYPQEGAVPLARDLGRPRTHIVNKARSIGVRCQQPHALAIRQAQARAWTAEEDALLRQEWPKVQKRQQSAIRVAERLGVTLFQVRQRAGDLGLRTHRVKEPPWTAAEEELLAQHVHLSVDTLYRRFRRAGYRRTAAAISVRRARLQLRVLGNGDYYSINELAGLLGISCQPIMRWIRQGWLKAKPRGDSENQWGGPGDRWLIAHKDVRKFITEHTAHAVNALATADKYWLVDLLSGEGK